MKSRSGLVLFVSAIMLSACESNRIYEKNIPIEKYVWDSRFKPGFEVAVTDTTVLYNLYLNIRHAELYPYRNIWLTISTQMPDGTQASRRIEITLAGEDGRWYGQGLGDIWDFRSLIQDHAFFNQPGTYHFTIEQEMRQDPLPGIMSVGIRLENSGIPRTPSGTGS